MLLVAAVILAYQPAWNAGFIWDDDVYVIKNKLLTAPDGLRRIWFSRDSPSQYCPLVYTAFRIERGFWGLNASGYHWVNILLHAVNAVLVWKIVNRLKIPGAWIAATLFALHPVQVESVAWVTERKNVLSLLFYLLAVLEWVRYLEEKPGDSIKSYVGVLVFYLLALLSKTTACTLPAALVLILWLKHKPINRRRWLQIIPLVVIGFCMGLLTMWWERYHQGTSGKVFAIAWPERILIASRAIWFYLGKLLWPVNLTFSYPRWAISRADPMAYAWLAACGAAAFAIFRLRKYLGRSLETAALFYAATLAPLLGFIMLYTFRYSFVADHYQYVASIGPLTLIGAGIALASRKWEGWTQLERRSAGARLAQPQQAAINTESFEISGPSSNSQAAAAGPAALRSGGTIKPWRCVFGIGLPLVIALTLTVLTWRQCRMYADADTLWRATLDRNSNSFMAQNNLGTSAFRKGNSDEAIARFREVIELEPDYEVGHYNLGDALVRIGQVDEALDQFKRAVELDPSYAKAHNNLGNIFALRHEWRQALDRYESAFRLAPRNPDSANNLAWLLATCPDAAVRNGARAVEVASIANQQSSREPAFLGTLAAAYAEAGRFPEAVSSARTALEWTLVQHNSPLAEALKKQVALYEAGKPLRNEERNPNDK